MTKWPDYDDPEVAAIGRSSGGLIRPIPQWPHTGDHLHQPALRRLSKDNAAGPLEFNLFENLRLLIKPRSAWNTRSKGKRKKEKGRNNGRIIAWSADGIRFVYESLHVT